MWGKFMKKAKPKIYKYNDIIVFLNDVLVFFKDKDKKSLRDLSTELKIANGLLSMILNRKRNLTEELLLKLLEKFSYNKNEVQFAENLRIISFSQNYQNRKMAIAKINKLKSYRDFKHIMIKVANIKIEDKR